MSRRYQPNEREKKSVARRAHALNRLDLRGPSTPRVTADSPTSHAIKARDPATEQAIAEFLANKAKGQTGT